MNRTAARIIGPANLVGWSVVVAITVSGRAFPEWVGIAAFATLLVLTHVPLTWRSITASTDDVQMLTHREMALVFSLWMLVGVVIIVFGWATWLAWVLAGLGGAGLMAAGVFLLRGSSEARPAS